MTIAEQRYVAALEKLVKAQDDMLVVYKTQAFHRGASVADRLGTARERAEKARAAIAPADPDTGARDGGREG